MKNKPKEFEGITEYDKWQYFKDYYLMKTIIALVLVMVVGSYIYTMTNKIENALYIAIINEDKWLDTNVMHQELIDLLDVDVKKEDVIISIYNLDEYADVTKLHTLMANNQVDVLISNDEVLAEYYEYDYLTDLTTLTDKATEVYGFELNNQSPYNQLDGSLVNPMLGIMTNTTRIDAIVEVLPYLINNQ